MPKLIQKKKNADHMKILLINNNKKLSHQMIRWFQHQGLHKHTHFTIHHRIIEQNLSFTQSTAFLYIGYDVNSYCEVGWWFFTKLMIPPQFTMKQKHCKF